MNRFLLPLTAFLLTGTVAQAGICPPNCEGPGDVDRCLNSLKGYEFGNQEKSDEGKHRSIQLKVAEKNFVWDGRTITTTDNPPKILWMSSRTKDGADGRANPSFPSVDLDQIKEKFIANSFSSFAKVKANTSNARMILNVSRACQNLTSVNLKKSNVGSMATARIEEVRAKFPTSAGASGEAPPASAESDR